MALWLVEHQPPKGARAPSAPSASVQSGRVSRRTIEPSTATGADLAILHRHYAEQQSRETGEDPAVIADRWRRFHAEIKR